LDIKKCEKLRVKLISDPTKTSQKDFFSFYSLLRKTDQLAARGGRGRGSSSLKLLGLAFLAL
jgi:hypothetical protein